MPILKTASVTSQIADTAYRLDIVRRDPAVIKATHAAMVDSAQAAKSIATCAVEINAAWRRSANPAGA